MSRTRSQRHPSETSETQTSQFNSMVRSIYFIFFGSCDAILTSDSWTFEFIVVFFCSVNGFHWISPVDVLAAHFDWFLALEFLFHFHLPFLCDALEENPVKPSNPVWFDGSFKSNFNFQWGSIFFGINFNLLQLEQDEKLGSIDWNFSIDWIKKSYHFVIDWSFLMRTSGSFVFSMEFFQQSQRGSIGSLLLRCAFFLSQRQTKNSVKPSKIALRKFVMAGWTIIFF